MHSWNVYYGSQYTVEIFTKEANMQWKCSPWMPINSGNCHYGSHNSLACSDQILKYDNILSNSWDWRRSDNDTSQCAWE